MSASVYGNFWAEHAYPKSGWNLFDRVLGYREAAPPAEPILLYSDSSAPIFEYFFNVVRREESEKYLYRFKLERAFIVKRPRDLIQFLTVFSVYNQDKPLSEENTNKEYWTTSVQYGNLKVGDPIRTEEDRHFLLLEQMLNYMYKKVKDHRHDWGVWISINYKFRDEDHVFHNTRRFHDLRKDYN